jgi:hypothetical protein
MPQSLLTTMPTTASFSSYTPPELASNIANALQEKTDEILKPIKELNQAIETALDLEAKISDCRTELNDRTNFINSITREYTKLNALINIDENPNLFLVDQSHLVHQLIQQNIRTHLNTNALGERILNHIDINLLTEETVDLQQLISAVSEAVRAVLQADAVSETNTVIQFLFEECNFIENTADYFLEEKIISEVSCYNEEQWLFLLVLAEGAHFSYNLRKLEEEAGELLDHFKNYNTLFTLLPAITDLYNENGFEGFLLSKLQQHVMPASVLLALDIPGLYEDTITRINELNTLISQLEKNLKDYIVQSKLTAKTTATDILDYKILARIRASVEYAAYLYKPQNAKRKGYFYHFFHGSYGINRSNRLENSLGKIDTSNIEKIKYIAESLSDQRETGGLRSNSFDTRLLIFLYNEGNPKGLFGLKFSEITRPTMNPTTSGRAEGIATPLFRGKQRLESTSDRNVIRLATQLMLFKLCTEMETLKNTKERGRHLRLIA